MGSAATFDHRTYKSAPGPECTDSPPAADDPFPSIRPLTTWILRCRPGRFRFGRARASVDTDQVRAVGDPRVPARVLGVLRNDVRPVMNTHPTAADHPRTRSPISRHGTE